MKLAATTLTWNVDLRLPVGILLSTRIDATVKTDILLLSLFAAITWGASVYFAGIATRTIGVQRTAFATQLTNLVVIVPMALVLQNRWSGRALGWGAVAAIGGAAGFLLMYGAMAKGSIGITDKLKSSVNALVPFVAGVVMGERPAGLAIAGFFLATGSVLVLSVSSVSTGSGSAQHNRRAALLAVLAGLAFGAGFVPLAHTNPADGVVPLVSYRVLISLTYLGLLRAQHERVEIERKQWPILLLSGTLAAAGDTTFIIALQRGPLSLVPAITTLSPLISMMLAWLFAHERLWRRQVVAIVMGLIGVVLIKL